MKLDDVAEPLEVQRCDLSGSTFRDVNLAGATITRVKHA
jgi:uncharacterized protein YjbI with pentapeptide repeats